MSRGDGGFVGRGEMRTIEILKKLFPDHEISQQVSIKDLINSHDFKQLGSEYNKHKHDIVLTDKEGKKTVIEVNYKHGKIAKEKWKIYKKYLFASGVEAVTIDDDECESLFKLKNGVHTDIWQDYIDVIRAFIRAGVSN